MSNQFGCSEMGDFSFTFLSRVVSHAQEQILCEVLIIKGSTQDLSEATCSDTHIKGNAAK